jgi:hypothetical protein
MTTAVAFLLVFGTLVTVSESWRILARPFSLFSLQSAAQPATGLTLVAGMVAAALIVGLLLGYALNLAREITRPRLARPSEAERVVGAPVIAVITPGDRSRSTSEVVDPYRLAYLSVSPAGARAHTIVITGDDCDLVTTVAARMARSSAADARATLVLDLDVERAPASGHYGIRNEPGFMDAIVGVHLWREVALPIGANEGLAIDIVPAGVRRRDMPDPTTTAEFEEFRDEHDFCVVIAPGEKAMRLACAIIRSPVTILCAQEEMTGLAALSTWRSLLAVLGASLHGVVVRRG